MASVFCQVACLLFFLISVRSSKCPKCKVCDESTTIKLNGCGLKTVPSNITLSAVWIDLSDNPLLQFKEDYFLRFKQLQKLLLNNCTRKEPVHLPSKLWYIGLSNNVLTTTSMKVTFTSAPRSLLFVAIRNNNANLSGILPFLPKGIGSLDAEGNILGTLKGGDLKGLENLVELRLTRCQIKTIESGAFSSLKKIHKLRLNKNELKKLPPKLFENNPISSLKLILSGNALTSVPDLSGIKSVSFLDISSNQLEEFFATKLGVSNIFSLDAHDNQIKALDLSSLQFYGADFSFNKIKALRDFAFSGSSEIAVLYLHNNEISNVSRHAFKNVKKISKLFLQSNNIANLPRGVFYGLSIGCIFLYRNQLSTMKGVLEGMTATPYQLLLFSNSKMQSFYESDYISMRENSEIYIDCKWFIEITGHKDFKAKIKCSASANLVISTVSEALRADGFQCHEKPPFHRFIYSCSACTVGRYSVRQEATCRDCPAGSFYQDEIASGSCKKCGLGQYVPPKYSPGKSPLDCRTCPKGTDIEKRMNYRACGCLPGFARTYRFGGCKRCTDKSFECTKDYKKLKRGFWYSWESTPHGMKCKRSFKDFIANLETFDDSYNRETMNFTNCSFPLPQKCQILGSCLGGVDAACVKGYTGILCGVCQKGYSRQFNKCIKCPKPYVAILQIIGYFLLFCVVCLLISWTDKMIVRKHDHSMGPKERRSLADIILSNLKILLGFYQVLSGIVHAFSRIPWPKNMKSAVNLFEYIQFQVFRIPTLRCIKETLVFDKVTEFWFVLISTAVIPIMILILFLFKLSFLCCKFKGTRRFRELYDNSARRYLQAVALFLFTTYPITSRIIIEILPVSCHTFCVSMTNQHCLRKLSYLRSDYSVKCLSLNGENRTSLVVGYVALLFPFGLPIALWLFLWICVRKRVTESNLDQDHSSLNYDLLDGVMHFDTDQEYINAEAFQPEGLKKSLIADALRFSYENYTDHCWYWEAIEMVRKLIMTAGVVLFLHHTKIGLGGIIVIAVAFTLIQATKNPIKDRFENFLQLLSLSIILINLAIGAVLQNNAVEDVDIIDAQEDSWALGLLLVVLNSLLVVLIFGRFITIIYSKICCGKNESN